MRLILTIASLAALLNARPGLMAQTSIERAVLKAVADSLTAPSSNIKLLVIAAPEECMPEEIGTRKGIDCVGKRFTATGRLRAAVAAEGIAGAVGGRVTGNPMQEIQLFRIPASKPVFRFCFDATEFAALLMPGPLTEIEPDSLWYITVTLYKYPKQSECLGVGNLVAVGVVRVGNAVRVEFMDFKRLYMGIPAPPQ